MQSLQRRPSPFANWLCEYWRRPFSFRHAAQIGIFEKAREQPSQATSKPLAASVTTDEHAFGSCCWGASASEVAPRVLLRSCRPRGCAAWSQRNAVVLSAGTYVT